MPGREKTIYAYRGKKTLMSRAGARGGEGTILLGKREKGHLTEKPTYAGNASKKGFHSPKKEDLIGSE